ncbi:MAG: tetratricopeptide repeat protein [Thiotrichales bacterium]
MRLKTRLLLLVPVTLVGLMACAATNTSGHRASSAVPLEVQRYEIAKTGLSDAAQLRADLVFELLAGEIAGVTGQLEQAIEHYGNASALSNDPAVAARTARIALYAKDYPLALQVTERWLDLEPDNIEARQAVGLLLVRLDRPEAAVEHLVKVIEHGPKDHEIAFTQLGLLFGQDTVTAAELKVMQLLRERYADVPRAHRVYAELAATTDEKAGALAAAEEALRLAPGDVPTRVLRNRLMATSDKADEAIADMEQLVREKPDDEGLRTSYARLLVQAGRYDKALVAFEKMLADFPDNPDLEYSVALLLLEQKQNAQARERLEKLLESARYSNEAAYYLGRIAQDETRYDQAIGWYMRVREGDYVIESQTRVADMLAKLGQIDKAREHLAGLREQVDDEALLVRLYLAEGQLLRDAERAQEAYDWYSAALQRYAENPDLLYARALTAEKIERLDLLERDLLAIIAQDPENATALNALGYTLADRTTRYDEALAYIEKALALRPDDPAILDSMGWVKYRLKDYESAERYLRQAYAKLQDAEIAAHLGEVLLMRGETNQARELVTNALQQAPEDERLLDLQKRFNP